MMNITISGGGETRGNDYFVTVDNRSADHLSCDEVLGVVASALFSETPIFVRTDEEREAWLKAIGTHDDNSIIEEEIAE